jgi:hypothetical protein
MKKSWLLGMKSLKVSSNPIWSVGVFSLIGFSLCINPVWIIHNLLLFLRSQVVRQRYYLARELVWGYKNVLAGFLYQKRDNITPEYLLPVSEGLKASISKFGINVPTEAVRIELSCDVHFPSVRTAFHTYRWVLLSLLWWHCLMQKFIHSWVCCV